MRITGIYKFEQTKKIELPFFSAVVNAGFPSPAEDYVEARLDLNEHLIKNPAATFFVRVEGNSMIGAGIHSGDILIVDKSKEYRNNSVIIAIINGEFTVKRIRKTKTKIYLSPDNPEFKEIEIIPSMDFEVWGVVIYVIHKL